MIVSLGRYAHGQIRNSQILFAEQPPTFQDYFGQSVAVTSSYVVVGSYRDQAHPPGAVYVYAREGASLDEISADTLSDGVDGDYFGVAVAADGETIAASRMPFGNDTSYVEIWERSLGEWTRRAVLPFKESRDKFGQSVAISGDLLAVGAPLADTGDPPERSGAVYVYRREAASGEWTEDAKLTPIDPDNLHYDQQFGTSVAIDGTTLVVGAPNQGDIFSGTSGLGAVTVYERGASGWERTAELTLDDVQPENRLTYFPSSVSVSGTRLVAGVARWSGEQTSQGLALVYDRTTGGEWKRTGTLSQWRPAEADLFGASVAVEDNTVLVGAPGRDPIFLLLGPVQDQGLVYVYRWDGLRWLPNGELGSTLDENSKPVRTGTSLALNAGMAVSGAPGPPNTFGMPGRAFVYGDIGSGTPIRLIDVFPADGAVDTGPAVTAVLTFDAPLDTTAAFDEGPGSFLAVETFPDTGEPGDIRLSPDSTVLEVDLNLQPDTRYTFLITGARSAATGGLLDRPYAFSFSTGSTLPTGQVTGTVSSGVDPAGSVVALFASTTEGISSVFSDEEMIQAVGVVTDPSGSYSVPFVGDGHYVAVAVRDADGNGTLDVLKGDSFGVFDTDGDNVADGLEVQAPSATAGIDITIATPPARTARAAYEGALAAARGIWPDSYPVALFAEVSPSDAAALLWTYVFHSPAMEQNFVVTVIGDQYMVSTFTASGPPFDPTTALPETWLDSAEALAIANANGGQAFQNDYAYAQVSAFLGNLLPGAGKSAPRSLNTTRGWLSSGTSGPWFAKASSAVIGGTPAWSTVFYTGYDSAVFSVLIHAETGEVNPILVATEGSTDVPSRADLHASYPNPFNLATTIRFDLPAPADTRLTVFDVLGRRARVLLSGLRPAGRHEVRFNATGLPSGVYFYRLRAGDYVETKRMVVVR
jgi:hypothetical protein